VPGPENSDYYRARAIEERWLARDAGRTDVATIHEELAIQYDALAEQLELRPSEDVRAVLQAVRAELEKR
jgi:hypothetical protein